MKKTALFVLLMACCSLKCFAWKYVVKECEIVSVTNNCCFKLWVSINKVDDNGMFLDHVCHGYVYTGCCSALPVHNAGTDNMGCGDEIYNGDYFYSGKDSQCMIPIVSQPDAYKEYTAKREDALTRWKEAQK